MSTVRNLLRVIPMILFMASCAPDRGWNLTAVQEFYGMPSDSASVLSCRKFFDRKIRPALELEAPRTWQTVRRLQGGRDPGVDGLRGILRSALFEEAHKAADSRSASLALSLLSPALKGTGGDKSPLRDSLNVFGDTLRFRRHLKSLAAGMALSALREIDSLRLARPDLAGRRMTELRYLMIFIPENESVVAGAVDLVWEALEVEPNAVNIARVRELLQASWPSLIPAKAPAGR